MNYIHKFLQSLTPQMADTLPQHTQQNNHRYVSDTFKSTDKSLDTGANGSVVFTGQNIHNSNVDKFDTVKYWRKHLSSVTPTVFPLCSSPGATLDSLIFRCFIVAHEGLTRNHGITLSTLVTVAYALVLSAHSNSSDEVVYGRVHCGQK
jgi:hypothetical protein